jgi:uridine kinase
VNSAAAVLERALARPVTLGTARLIALEGPSGSGKSTLADELARISGAHVVRTDDLCPGWDGLPEVPRILVDLLGPVASGSTGRTPRYDWILGHHVEDLEVAPAALVVLDGVGSGGRLLAPLTTLLVWLDADPDLRRTRALERDGAAFAEHWAPWAASEAAYFAAEDLPARADLILRAD